MAEASKEVADLLLAGVDDLAHGGLVHRVGNAATNLLELGTEGFDQGLG
jgi:hypothetical protein